MLREDGRRAHEARAASARPAAATAGAKGPAAVRGAAGMARGRGEDAGACRPTSSSTTACCARSLRCCRRPWMSWAQIKGVGASKLQRYGAGVLAAGLARVPG